MCPLQWTQPIFKICFFKIYLNSESIRINLIFFLLSNTQKAEWTKKIGSFFLAPQKVVSLKKILLKNFLWSWFGRISYYWSEKYSLNLTKIQFSGLWLFIQILSQHTVSYLKIKWNNFFQSLKYSGQKISHYSVWRWSKSNLGFIWYLSDSSFASTYKKSAYLLSKFRSTRIELPDNWFYWNMLLLNFEAATGDL